MNIGVVFPQTELQPKASTLRTYATGIESLGFTHILAYDHILGADPLVHRGWQGPYDVTTMFHEPLVLFGYLSAFTSLEFVTGIIVLPQRQTALLAKQAAQVDILSSGRLRLGVGVGWNSVEYEALGKIFADRGKRIDQQIRILRRLWTERSISAETPDERIRGAGIAPLPIQRPIPIWLGGQSARAYRRIGALGDGWIPEVQPGPDLDGALSIIRVSAELADRDPREIGMEGRVRCAQHSVPQIIEMIIAWKQAGASYVSIDTMGAGFQSVKEHLALLAEVQNALSAQS